MASCSVDTFRGSSQAVELCHPLINRSLFKAMRYCLSFYFVVLDTTNRLVYCKPGIPQQLTVNYPPQSLPNFEGRLFCEPFDAVIICAHTLNGSWWDCVAGALFACLFLSSFKAFAVFLSPSIFPSVSLSLSFDDVRGLLPCDLAVTFSVVCCSFHVAIPFLFASG